MRIQSGFDFTQTAAGWYWERKNRLCSWFHQAKEQVELDHLNGGQTTLAAREYQWSCVEAAWEKACCYLGSLLTYLKSVWKT
jgi:hypothetical protein